MPGLATWKWWKEERRGVFLDYNQNAKDRTTCSAYSIRPLPDARVSAPLAWNEVPGCDPADFTVATMPARFAAIGNPHAGMDEAAGSAALLDLPRATWRPASATSLAAELAKQEGEAPRVSPSRAKGAAKKPPVRMPLDHDRQFPRPDRADQHHDAGAARQ